MNKFTYILLLFIVNIGAYAGEVDTGKNLLFVCESSMKQFAGKEFDVGDSSSCLHFLVGFDSGQSVVALTRDQKMLYCQPKGSNVKNMVESVVNVLRKDPTYHDAPAGIAVWKALESSWPCR